MRSLLLLLLLCGTSVFAQTHRDFDTGSVITEPICPRIPDGTTFTAAGNLDFDTAGLTITADSGASATGQSYSGASIVDVSVPGTYEAVAAGEVGVDRVTNCVKLHLHNEVLAGNGVTITLSDGQTNIMDWTHSVVNLESSEALSTLVRNEVDLGLAAYDAPTLAEMEAEFLIVLNRLGSPAAADMSTDIANVASAVNSVGSDVGQLDTTLDSVSERLPASLLDGLMQVDLQSINGCTVSPTVPFTVTCP